VMIVVGVVPTLAVFQAEGRDRPHQRYLAGRRSHGPLEKTRAFGITPGKFKGSN